MLTTKVNEIDLGGSDAPVKLFLIHGYTGSPTDFNQLPDFLHDQYGVRVRVPLLPGHGTEVNDLDNYNYEDFIQKVEKEFAQERQKGGKILVGGVSFGALVALRLAAKYPVDGVVNISIPFSLKMPFGMPGIKWLRLIKKYWRKKVKSDEIGLRRDSFHYDYMHVNGLGIVKQAKREVKDNLRGVTCPIITIHSNHDPIGSVRGVHKLQKKMAKDHQVVMYDNPNHNIFFSNKHTDAYQKIGDFVQDTIKSRSVKTKHKVAAIVPAYNEADRIKPVLETLIRTDLINEVMVVDDGSTDKTSEIARAVPGVKVITNKENKGKAASLQLAIDQTKADVLFFCDADLEELTPEIVTEIINPVVLEQRDMFIGVRNNVTQKALTLFALNSGERALRREVWEEMPDIFKYRYRLEVGLNATARWRKNGYGWKKFPYYQTFKERKYGFVKGTILRWWMNLDVLYAYAVVVGRRVLGRRGLVAEKKTGI